MAFDAEVQGAVAGPTASICFRTDSRCWAIEPAMAARTRSAWDWASCIKNRANHHIAIGIIGRTLSFLEGLRARLPRLSRNRCRRFVQNDQFGTTITGAALSGIVWFGGLVRLISRCLHAILLNLITGS